MIVRPFIERFAEEHTTRPSPLLQRVFEATTTGSEHPEMMIGAVEGALLGLLVFLARPRRILEIGTFTGYSALAMAEAMPSQCRIATIEADPDHAAVARGHFDSTQYGDRIDLVEGPALQVLATLDDTFDVVFIDADKPSYVDLLDASLPLLSDDGIVIVDNALHFAISPDPEDAAGVRDFDAYVASRTDLVQVLLTVRAGIMLIRRAGADGGHEVAGP